MKLLSAVALSILLHVPGSVFSRDTPPDQIVVAINHPERMPTDPVQIQFTKFKVTKTTIPSKVEGGTATIEVDATSLKSGNDKRDAHLRTPDFLDATKFPKIVITLGNVKRTGTNVFSAVATMAHHDQRKTYPLTLTVIDQTGGKVRVSGGWSFSRADFKWGKDQKAYGLTDELRLANQATISVVLTVKS